MANNDATYVPILPSFDKFFGDVDKGAKKGGKQAGQAFSDAMGREMQRTQRSVDKASGAYERARDRATTAADKTRVAELKLAEVVDKGDASASKLAKATSDVEKARRDQTRAESDAERASSALTSAQEDLSKASQESADALEAVGDTGAGIGDKIMGGLKTMSVGALLGIGAKIGTSILDGVTDAVKGSWESALAMDTGQRVLEGMYGSAEAANEMMGKLRNVASDSPIDYVAYQKAAESLAYTGVQGDRAADILKNVGLAATSAGKGDEAFESVNGALARMTNEGKVGLQSLNQLSGAGVPILSGLAEHFGVSMEEVNKMVSDGAVGIEDVLSVMENATGDYFQNALTAGEAAGDSLENQMKMIKDNITTNVAAAIVPILQELQPVIKSLGEALQDFAGWVQDNSKLVIGFASVVGGALAGFVAWKTTMVAITTAQKAWNAVLALSTVGMKGLNAAMRANLIGIIVTAIAALVAGLTYFFTQTETGKRVWDSFMGALSAAGSWISDTFGPMFSWLGDVVSAAWEGIKTGWDFLWGAFEWAWTTILEPVLNAFMTAAKVLAAVVLTAVIAPIMVAWEALSWAFRTYYEMFVKPTFDNLAAAASWLWENVLQPVFGWIGDRWGEVSGSIRDAWENIIKVAWDALQAALRFMWDVVVSPILGFIQDRWHALSDAISWAWENIIRPAWDALNAALRFMWDNVFAPILGFIQNRWQEMATAIQWVKDTIIQPVFDSIAQGLDILQGVFQTAVDGIGRIWDGLRAAAAKPVKFVIDSVWNNGIVAAWNKIAGFIPGLDEVDEFHPSWLGGFKTGGVLPGYSPGKDIHEFTSPTGGRIGLSGGEAIMRPEWTRAVGGPSAVEAMNRAAMHGTNRVKRELGEGAAYAKGGVIDDKIDATMAEAKKYHGMPYQWGGIRNPSFDCSGLWSAIVSHLNGGPFEGRLFTTHPFEGGQGYPGFSPGLNGRVTIGAGNGHMAGTIDGVNLESGGSNGVQIGGAAIGSEHPMFHAHYTLDDFMGEYISGGSGGGGGGGIASYLLNKAKDVWNGIVDKIKDSMPDFGGRFGEIPGAALSLLKDKAWEFIRSKIPIGGGGSGPNADWDAGAGAEQWREMIIAAFENQGEVPRQDLVDALVRQISSESNGDPNIAQQIVDMNGTGESAGVGLFQVIPDTWEGYRDPALPDNRRDPWAQANFAVRYFRDRHNYDTGWVGQGHGWKTGGVLPENLGVYDEGGYLEPGQIGVNQSRKVEPVFTNEQWQTIADSIWTRANAQQWDEMVDEMTAAAETFANGAEEIGRQFEADFAAWQRGEDIQVTEDDRLMRPDEMGAQIGYWFGSELAGEFGDMFGLSSGMVDDLLGAGGLVDPGFDESGLVRLESQDVQAEQVNVSAESLDSDAVDADAVDVSSIDAAADDLPETSDDKPAIVIENVTVEGNATEEDGKRFVAGALEEARTRGRMARIN